MDQSDVHRAYRAVRLIHTGAKIAAEHGVGLTGTQVALRVIGKAGLITAVADAVISVAGAIGTYLELQQEKEQTEQLRILISLEEERLNAGLATLKLYKNKELARLEDRRKLAESGEVVRKQTFRLLETIRTALDEIKAIRGWEVLQPEEYHRHVNMYLHVVQQYSDLADELDGAA